MPPTIVLVVDGLSATLPGPYGNTTVETPTLNRFASESALFDFCFVEFPALFQSCPILWKGLIDENGGILVSDCTDVLTLASDYPFESVVDATGVRKLALAGDISATQTANFFAHAIEAIQMLDSDGLCWLHHVGFTGQWDAPWDLRCTFADEEDPEPPRDVDRPIGEFDPREVDPDQLLGYQHSAYAQLAVFDQLFGVFLEQLRQNGILDQVNFVLASTRGYPLGEHGIVGQFDNLFNETIQVPLMIRKATDLEQPSPSFGSRHGGLVQLEQLNQMVAGLMDGGFHSVPFCEVAKSAVGQLRSLNNGRWKLIFDPEAIESARLYAKPDDRWDMNDVSRRCADVVEEMIGESESVRNVEENDK